MSDCPRTTNPASTAITGPRLISTANVEVGSVRRARSSSEYGSADERTATAAPSARTAGSPSAEPADSAVVTPQGSVSTAPTPIASASPSAFGKRAPTRALSTM